MANAKSKLGHLFRRRKKTKLHEATSMPNHLNDLLSEEDSETDYASFVNPPKRRKSKNTLKMTRDLQILGLQLGLRNEDIERRFQEFCVMTEGRPSKGLNVKQFYRLYQRAYPHAISPYRLSTSVFRLCDQNMDGVIEFKEFLSSLCIPTSRIPTILKFRTLFRIFDLQQLGYLTPGVMVCVLRDVYDIMGLLSSHDHHKEAIELFNRMDHDKNCMVHESEFVRCLMTDPYWVYLLETSNFCVPSTEMFYMGHSSFWGMQNTVKSVHDMDTVSIKSAPGSVMLTRKAFMKSTTTLQDFNT